jgi:hypothetical protein
MRLRITIVFFILIAALGFSPVLYAKVEATGGTTLVHRFCQLHTGEGKSAAENETDWNRLFDWLRQRSPLKSKALAAPHARVEECVAAYRTDFEEAEFILRGLDVLEHTERKEQASLQVDPNELPLKEKRQLSEAGHEILAGLVPMPSKTEAARNQMALDEGIQTRREAYLKLWSNFARRLRQKVTNLTVAQSSSLTQRNE